MENRRDNKGRILRNGESQRSDGRYMYRYLGADGKRETVYSWKLVETDTAPNGKKCKESLREMEKRIQKDLDDGILSSSAGKTTLNDFFTALMSARTDLRETTRCNYLYRFNAFIRNTIGEKTLTTIRYNSIKSLYSSMHNKGLSEGTIGCVHSLLHQIMNQAIEEHMIRDNPTKKAYKLYRRECPDRRDKRHALTVQEQAELIRYVRETPQFNRYHTLFTVLLGTGMRIGELLGLRWDDCDLENGIIHVRHSVTYRETENGNVSYRISTPKTASGIRDIPMFEDVKRALIKEKERVSKKTPGQFEIDGYSGFVFLNRNGKVFLPASLYTTIQRLVSSHNVEEERKAVEDGIEPVYLPHFSAHNLRHTFCTRMCEQNTNIKVIQEVMGHKSASTTMDIYNEATADTKKISFAGLENAFPLA